MNSKKRASIDSRRTCTSDNIGIYCSHCGLYFGADKHVDVKKSLAGHLRWCVQESRNEKRFRYSNDDNDDCAFDSIQSEDICYSDNEDNIPVASNIIEMSSQITFLSDKSYYYWQQKLFNVYENVINIRIHLNKQKERSNIEDNILLLETKLKLKLSNQEGDEMLKCFKRIIDRNLLQQSFLIPLVSSFRIINYQMDKNLINDINKNTAKEIQRSNAQVNNKTFTVFEYNYKLESTVFPDLQSKSTKAFSFDIMEVIAEELLNMNPNNFRDKPDIRFTESGFRIFEDYTTGTHFENINSEVEEICNSGVALCIGVTLDETTTRSFKKTETPVNIFLLNSFDDSFRMLLIGYVPAELPYPDAVIKKYLQNKFGKGTKGLVDKILMMYKRKQYINYLYDILSPILKYQKNGVILNIGGNKIGARNINAFPHFVLISGDTASSHFLAGSSFQKKNMKCRLCTTTDCVTFSYNAKQFPFRDDNAMEQLGLIGQEALLLKAKKLKKLSPNEIEYIKNIEEKLYEYNITSGFNPLIGLFQWQNERNINSFYKSLVPDYLHTVYKGVIEYAVEWSIGCLFAVAELDIVYNNNMTLINDRISRFPIIHSLDIFEGRRHRFNDILQLFKKPWNKESQGTGLSKAGMEAWKWCHLLIQLLFSINKDIVPFDKLWFKNKIKNTQNSFIPGQVLINALSSALELHLACRAEILTPPAMKSFEKIICNCRAHLSLLWSMRKQLITGVKLKHNSNYLPKKRGLKNLKPTIHIKKAQAFSFTKQTNSSKKVKEVKVEHISEFFDGIKLHLISHYPYYKEFFGAYKRTMDTEISELSHKLTVKENYENTNKKQNQIQRQLLINIKKKIHCHYLNEFYDKKEYLSKIPQKVPINASSSVEVCTYYSVSQSGCDIIVYNNFTDKYNVKSKKNLMTSTSTAVNNNIANFSDIILFINNKVSQWVVDKVDISSDNGVFMNLWLKFKLATVQLLFSKCVSCKIKKGESNLQDYKIYCDQTYTENKFDRKLTNDDDAVSNTNKKVLPVFNFIEVNYKVHDSEETFTELAQIVCIFNFIETDENKVKKETIFLLVAWLTKSKVLKSDSKKIMPYPCYSYDFFEDSKPISRPLMWIIPITSVYRPAYVICYQDVGCKWETNLNVSLAINNLSQKLTTKDLKCYNFYMIPYERAFRRICDGFVQFVNDVDMVNVVSNSQVNVINSSNNKLPNRDYLQNNEIIDVPMMLNETQIIMLQNFIKKIGLNDEPDSTESDESELNSELDSESTVSEPNEE